MRPDTLRLVRRVIFSVHSLSACPEVLVFSHEHFHQCASAYWGSSLYTCSSSYLLRKRPSSSDTGRLRAITCYQGANRAGCFTRNLNSTLPIFTRPTSGSEYASSCNQPTADAEVMGAVYDRIICGMYRPNQQFPASQVTNRLQVDVARRSVLTPEFLLPNVGIFKLGR